MDVDLCLDELSIYASFGFDVCRSSSLESTCEALKFGDCADTINLRGGAAW